MCIVLFNLQFRRNTVVVDIHLSFNWTYVFCYLDIWAAWMNLNLICNSTAPVICIFMCVCVCEDHQTHRKVMKILHKLAIATFLMRNNVDRLSCHLSARGPFSWVSVSVLLLKFSVSFTIIAKKTIAATTRRSYFENILLQFSSNLITYCSANAICNAWLIYSICYFDTKLPFDKATQVSICSHSKLSRNPNIAYSHFYSPYKFNQIHFIFKKFDLAHKKLFSGMTKIQI